MSFEVIHFPPGFAPGRRRSSGTSSADRFIPRRLRGYDQLDLANFKLTGSGDQLLRFRNNSTQSSGSRSSVESVEDVLVCESQVIRGENIECLVNRRSSLPHPLTERILTFAEPSNAFSSPSPVPTSKPKHTSPLWTPGSKRYVPRSPEKILDLPGFANQTLDTGSNRMDWSSRDMIAVALENNAYAWRADTGDVLEFSEILDRDDEASSYDNEHGLNNTVTSLAWNPDGTLLSLSKRPGEVKVIDVESEKESSAHHTTCKSINSIAWATATSNIGPCVFYRGSACGCITECDIRCPTTQQCNVEWLRNKTGSPVYAIKVSPDGRYLACGMADQHLQILSLRQAGKVIYDVEAHSTPVKALDWCPWKPCMLITGGGEGDGTLKLWNVNTGAIMNKVQTHAEVSAVKWCPDQKELAVGGGAGCREVSLWQYPYLEKAASLLAHKAPVTGMALSPDSKTLASAGMDETLALWKCFSTTYKRVPERRSSCFSISSFNHNGTTIR